MEILLSLGVMGACFLALGLGAMLSSKVRLHGSCGGLSGKLSELSCGACGGDPEQCPNKKDRADI